MPSRLRLHPANGKEDGKRTRKEDIRDLYLIFLLPEDVSWKIDFVFSSLSLSLISLIHPWLNFTSMIIYMNE